MKRLSLTACVALMLLGCSATEAQTSRDDATELVVDELELPDNGSVVVYSLETPLSPNDVITTGTPADLGAPEELPVLTESWFFWIDDDPGARFSHPNRFVLVPTDGSEITVFDSMWWPVVNGTAPWLTKAELDDPGTIAYPELPSEEPRQGAVQIPRTMENTCAGNKGQALIINGWEEGDTGEEDFAADAQNMSTTLGEQLAGFEITSVEVPAGGGAPTWASNWAI